MSHTFSFTSKFAPGDTVYFGNSATHLPVGIPRSSWRPRILRDRVLSVLPVPDSSTESGFSIEYTFVGGKNNRINSRRREGEIFATVEEVIAWAKANIDNMAKEMKEELDILASQEPMDYEFA